MSEPQNPVQRKRIYLLEVVFCTISPPSFPPELSPCTFIYNGQLCIPGDIWQYLEIFLVVTLGGVSLKRLGILSSIQQYADQPHKKKKKSMQSQMLIM